MFRVGIDIIEVQRVQRSVDRFGDRFLTRIYTDLEREYCNGRAPSLAGRFALKEAVAKALGTGIGDVCWKEIEILNDRAGRPVLHLDGAARDLSDSLGLEQWDISLSHSGTHAIGIAIASSGQNTLTETESQKTIL